MPSETPGAESAEPMDWEAVARYLAGESPASEQARVHQWLADHPAEARMLASLDDALAGLTLGADAQKGIDVDAAFASVLARRDSGLKVVRGDAPKLAAFNNTRSSGRWARIAVAAAILLAVGTFAVNRYGTRTPSVEMMSFQSFTAGRAITTGFGGRDSITLSDGTRVILGPGSELQVGSNYQSGDRAVRVRGDAFFTVVHNGAHPFRVLVDGGQVSDVGTAFAIHNDTDRVRVVVTEGIVAVTRPEKSVQLAAGDVATLSGREIVTQRGAGNTDDVAWTRGELVFRDTPLSEVREDIHRWYGVTLDVRDSSLLTRPLSATFHGDPIRKVLETISLALGASVDQHGDTAVLRLVPR